MKPFWILLLWMSAISYADEEVVNVETVKTEDDVVYLTPKSDPDVFFTDHFDDEVAFQKKWIKSKAKKDGVEESIAKYDGEWALEKAQKDPLSGDLGLVLKSKAKHAAISAPLGKIFKFDENPFVVQYELNFQVLCFALQLKLICINFKILIIFPGWTRLRRRIHQIIITHKKS